MSILLVNSTLSMYNIILTVIYVKLWVSDVKSIQETNVDITQVYIWRILIINKIKKWIPLYIR